jgi:H+/gluconate symporter-like permease
LIEIVGILLSLVLLIVLVYKKVNLIPASMISIVLLVATNQLSYMDIMMNDYAVSLGNFIANYFMLFVTNALFGKIMEETLLAAELSKLIGKYFGDKNAVYGAMLATALLTYGGISVFVIVFTVYPIFLATFQKADLPRRYIPAAIMGSSSTFALAMAPGSAQINNIIPTEYIDTTASAGFLIGIVTTIISILLLIAYFEYLFSKARKNDEHFEMDENTARRINNFNKDSGINSWFSLFPLILVLVFINTLGYSLSISVLAGAVLALVIGWKNVPNKLQSINESFQMVSPAMVTTAVSVGFGGAVFASPGAQVILEKIVALPFNSTISLSIASAFAGMLTGSGGGGVDVAMDLFSQKYLTLGVHPAVMHRIVAIATAGFSCLPHNGMILTIIETSGSSVKESYKYIFVTNVLTSIIALIVANVIGFALY